MRYLSVFWALASEVDPSPSPSNLPVDVPPVEAVMPPSSAARWLPTVTLRVTRRSPNGQWFGDGAWTETVPLGVSGMVMLSWGRGGSL